MNRESGFYWVLLEGKGIIAEWDKEKEYWAICGQYMRYSDSAFQEIKERKLIDPWATNIEIS